VSAAASSTSGGLAAGVTLDPLTGGEAVLPLGDSITYGLGGTSGYRIPLWSRFFQDGRDLNFVGTQTGGSPEFFSEPEHEGHIGWTVMDLIQFDGGGVEPSSTIEGLLAASEPEKVLLHIGTNDMLSFDEWHLASKRVGVLLDRIWAVDPRIAVHLATIVPTGDPSANLSVDWFNDRLRELAHLRYIDGASIRLVDIATALEGIEMADAVHPSPAGYDEMAAQWYEALTTPAQPIPPLQQPPPAVPGLIPTASSFMEGHLPDLATNGVGLEGSLHDFEQSTQPLGWRSEPFDQVVGEEGYGVPISDPPSFQLRLPAPVDVQALELWNGRNVDAGGGVWLNLESVRSVRVQTLSGGSGWVDRGVLEFVRGPGRSRAPAERIEVDWPDTLRIRLQVLTTHGNPASSPGPFTTPVAISEIQVLGVQAGVVEAQ
jgi:lysophospholipase L1-like esterase